MYEADGTRREHKSFTSDNCSDQGSIPSEGEVYTTDFGSSSYNFTNVGIYSTYNGGTRTGYADVYYSDDGNTWTYSFTSVVTNANQCGERVGTLSESDNLLDSPTNYEDGTNIGGNYAVMNPLSARSQVSVSNGNLDCTVTSNSHSWTGRKVFSTIGVNSGKWYAEMTVNSEGSVYAAICGNTENINESNSIGWQSQGWGYYQGGIIVIQTTENSSGIPAYGLGDTIGVALDVDNLKVKFYKNGTQVGTTAGYDITADLTWFFAFDSYDESDVSWNFGQRPFKISSVPTGHKALCTENFDTPLIPKPSKAFDVLTWGGNNSSPRSFTGMDMSPDFIWSKCRNQLYWHNLTDSVRGPSRALHTNQPNGEDTTNDAAYGSVTSFNSDGFTLTSGNDGSIPHAWVNESGRNYVAWTWDGGDFVTNSAYNQSQTWSSGGGSGLYSGSTWGPVFNGTPATSGSDIALSAYVTNSGTSTLTFATAISGTLKATVCQGSNSPGTGADRPTVTLSDGSVQYVAAANNSPEVINFGSVSNITTLTIAGTSAQGMNLIKLELDNKELVDPGVIPVGSLNSSVYNQDQQWSNGWTGQSGTSGRVPTNAFNGDLSNWAFAGNNGANEYVEYSFTATM